MFNSVNSFLAHWEPLWLFLLIAFESLMGLVTVVVLYYEYVYDKAFNESIKASRKERRRKKYEMTLPEQTLTDGEAR
jgi:hypothetical protein